MAKILTSKTVVRYIKNAEKRGESCPGRLCDGYCDLCIWTSSFDALSSIEALGARVTRESVEPVFAAPFTRLTAFINGKEVASVSRPWDLAEGLWDLLADVEAYNADAMFVDDAITCAGCGGPCDAVDAVADDFGSALCGSVYGNGCAESAAGAMFVDGVLVARTTHVSI
jgi:hypothetical protein